MSIIVEYEHDSKTLLGALQAVPEMTLDHNEAYFTPDGSTKWFFWASGDDFAKFEKALTDDDTVERVKLITAIQDRRLYSVDLKPRPEDVVLKTTTQLDIQVLASTHSGGKSVLRIRCPSREAFVELKDVIEETFGTITTHRLYREELPNSGGFSVTPAQQEALLLALDEGYFDIPRKTTLEATAEKLNISDNAMSARLRRGIAALLGDTLAYEQTI